MPETHLTILKYVNPNGDANAILRQYPIETSRDLGHHVSCMETFLLLYGRLMVDDGSAGLLCEELTGKRESGKVFVRRDSPLTELFHSKHGRSLYTVCMVLPLLAVAPSMVVSITSGDELQDGPMILWNNVKGIPLAIVCWAITFTLVFLFYIIFRCWTQKRSSCQFPMLLDAVMIGPFLVTSILLLTFPATAVCLLPLPTVCRFGLLMEQMRFLLKLYSFLRVKLPNAWAGQVSLPSYFDMIIFLTVPTMIYKDTYPRANPIRWKKLVLHCFELGFTGVIGAVLIAKVHTSAVLQFRSVWLDGTALLIALFSNLVPTTLILFVGFFGYFHSFSNLAAEVTGFEDRLFYKDWWNATSFKAWFTTWNTVIQDWLYYHVYLDVRAITGHSQVADLVVFAVSGVLHEYVLSFFFGFFYPVMAVVFVGVGSILKAIPTSKVSPGFGNLVLWLCIPMGSGIMFTAYMTEISSRINCPYTADAGVWSDYFIPRSWSCPMEEEPTTLLTT